MWFGEGDIGIVHGKYDYENARMSFPKRLRHANSEKVEKNWVHLPYQGKDCIVYKWHPLEIYDLSDTDQDLRKVTESDTPRIFRFARGSTNGVLDPITKTDLWFIVHLVSYETPRYYYHMILTLDANTLKLKKYSAPFRFNMNSPIQYSIGLCVTDTEFLVSYSDWDRTSNILIFPREHILKLLTFKA